jgi:hypothetical protein
MAEGRPKGMNYTLMTATMSLPPMFQSLSSQCTFSPSSAKQPLWYLKAERVRGKNFTEGFTFGKWCEWMET